ncbi:MAG: bifunctional diaminohydroxyphosphoribosylaminopyrimidine deaminase/5-amino-6-(5-phosphoribosylamino)uracil reductase RibD [Actinobacteria bacterium]|nr:bifunctional diaminohydroxyphosphoribosylaminopyrimidine deaminase/5-amino-6-(5-phosphoribosylamino)uracil reductase RibD [Actinomycetota bacterium]
MTASDERFMARALELARAVPRPSPNPRVGAVLVRDGAIVAEAAHEGPGRPHAERTALDGIDATGCTLYVTLEPCSHQGRTPPCAPAVVEAGIRRVVAPFEDPDVRVQGRGFEMLRASGVEVSVGVLASEARALNSAWAHQRRTGRARVTLKLALSLDGRLAATDGSARWITGAAARAHVHTRRAEADGIVVGAGTVASDDPQLTARVSTDVHQPARVIVDSVGRTSSRARVFAVGAQVIVATTHRCSHETQTAWKETGAEVVALPSGPGGVDLSALVAELSRRDWLEIYCEGGARLASSLLRERVVDRLELYYGPVVLGDSGPGIGGLGIDSMDQASRFTLVETRRFEDDVLVILERGGR